MDRINQTRLRELLEYNSETGVFRWKKAPRRGVAKGGVAGGFTKRGYRIIGLDKKRYYAHRLVWLWVYGEFPQFEIDHKNGNIDDNWQSNLREATHLENGQNTKMWSHNTSGYRGVNWRSDINKWQSRINFNNKVFYLGCFHNAKDAYVAYLTAKSKLHAFQPVPRDMARHG